jgi:hypothetical protein
MNYKRKKIKPAYRRIRHKQRTSSLTGWMYGRAIAKENILYKEFKTQKYFLLN